MDSDREQFYFGMISMDIVALVAKSDDMGL